ncbi:MAG: hypothetical protein Harvfovirus3_59 [Harvfovirus sp.]|uniref:Uncharacterized protein n=1 Tax=Harvfovirus sp. TaxID=2487768 RepID=A0A3G5A279_9VIRU|nr:MAG: hypothetical protein Harvfovirus3_59 [Harvfovirus sp.]
MSSIGLFPPNLFDNLSGEKIIEMLKQTKIRENNKCSPPPPRLPRNFRWKGTYVVPDLNIRVSFTWTGSNNNIQMIAGSESEPIHFTNLIFDGYLYTLTYKWPGVTEPPKCLRLFPFTRQDLNQILATSVFVGEEIILNKSCCYNVNHFRFTIVLPQLPPGNLLRFAISEADIYVDCDDSTKFRKVLHFGYQNLLDPQLDEWIIIDKIEDEPGFVMLPECCTE